MEWKRRAEGGGDKGKEQRRYQQQAGVISPRS